MKLELVKYVDTVFYPKLWTWCKNEVPVKEAFKYVHEMKSIMEHEGGQGLAANQVGLDIPLFITTIDNRPQACYRPKLLNSAPTGWYEEEKCLSLPGTKVNVYRPYWIDVQFVAESNGKQKKLRLYGKEARCWFHEFEHLQGITILDKRDGSA